MNDLEQEIQELRKRVEQLETKKNNSALFGRTFSQLGTTDSDLLLKTRGQVKIQWGNKYIDLIKDGKFITNSKVLYEVSSVQDIISNGIYLVNGQVFLKIGNNAPVSLNNDGNTSYVSFMVQSGITSDQKHTALSNIGFLYESLDDFDENSLENGIIYVEQEKKLYTVTNGVLSEFSLASSSTFDKSVIIQKNTPDKGSLIIKGLGVSNSLAFDTMHIYSDLSYNKIDSQTKNLIIYISGQEKMSITNMGVKIGNLHTTTIQSEDSDQNKGFMIKEENGLYTLTIDKVIQRISSDNQELLVLPEYYLHNINIISTATQINITDSGFEATLLLGLPNTYQINDELIFFCYASTTEDSTEDSIQTLKKVLIKVTSSNENSIVIQGEDSLDYSTLESLSNTLLMLIKRDNQFPIRIKDNTIDIYSQEGPIARFGNLDEIQDKNPLDSLQNGIYSQLGLFDNACYVNTYNLASDDNSSRLASTEWVNQKISIPPGCILLHSIENIPDGWGICNGENGTPDLQNYYIQTEEMDLVYIIKL